MKLEHPKNRLAEKISNGAETFTPSDRLIADYLLRAYPLSLLQNASEIADELNINTTTVTRFFPKIGYRNIREARTDFRQDIQFMVNSPLDRFRTQGQEATGSANSFSKVMEMDWSNIQNTLNVLREETVSTFFELIDDHSKAIYTLGTRKEFSLAYYFFMKVSSFRYDTRILNSANVVDQLANIHSGDILAVFDFRRYSRLHEKACKYVSEAGGKVIVFADSPIAPAANLADCLFLINTSAPSVFDSYTAGMTLINILLFEMVKRHGKDLEEKQARLDSLFEQFGIFKFQQKFPLKIPCDKGGRE
jgi:DNA-binding MurR/RpiR family transcriptional regulator